MGYSGDKTTIMVLNVDLQCCSCYKKIKKILCKFPQIRNQVYDEKKNTVTISVVCCDPEKLRDKLCSKGCGVIISIEIKEPEKPKSEKSTPPQKSKQPQETKVIQKVKVVVIENPKEPEKKVEVITEKPTPPPVTPPPELQIQQPPPGFCCVECSEGHTRGPCYKLYRRPFPPLPCYDYYGPCPRPYSYGKECYVIRCDQYFSDENATGCSIM